MLKSKRFKFIEVLILPGILIVLPCQSFAVNTTIISTIGDLDGSGDSVGENAVIQAAVNCWDARITTNRNFTLNITGGNLTGGTLGQGATTAIDGNNTPTAGSITIDNSSRTWFIDLTPNDASEFTPDANNQWRFLSGPANSELYATVIHEVGHASGWLCGATCGFNNPDYDALYVPQPVNFVSNATCNPPFPIAGQPALAGCVHLTTPSYDVSLRGDGLGGSGSSTVNELSHPGVGGDLMEGFGASGQRETPSEDDVDMFRVAYGDTVNLPPTVDLGLDIVSECNVTGGSSESLDGTASTDPDGDALTHSWSCPGIVLADANTATPAGFFPLDSTTTCRDDVTDLAQCIPNAREVDVAVVDTTSPDITAPANVTAECASPAGTNVFLGSPIVSDICDASLAVGNDAPALFPLGITNVQWDVADDSGNTNSDIQQVTIEDTIPPNITLAVSPTTLWAPDHKLVTIQATITVDDICDASPTVRLVSITSNESDNGLGDGDTVDDIQGADFGTDDREFQVRAERSGMGQGRVYTITYEVVDGSGNTTQQQAVVDVPKSNK